MVTNLEQELFLKSRKLWGLHSQLLMLAEEAAELGVATLHLGRANKDKDVAWENFCEEIADVEFMIAEMKEYFSDLQPRVDYYRLKKVKRLDQLIVSSEKRSKNNVKNH